MKKRSIGYIFCEQNFGKDDKAFMKIAKKKRINLVLFNVGKEVDEEEISKKAKECKVIFNNSAEDIAIEIVKTLEELGKEVIDSSKIFYYTEDKWMFYLKCKENNIPTPETNLLSENLNFIENELKKFNHWPVILKRVEGTCGEYVEKAENSEEAIKIIRSFWKKGVERLPIIAQEMVKSPSYRITAIDGKIAQTAIKTCKKGWKATGVFAKKIKKFPVDKELINIVKKITRTMKIKICGIDLLKKEGKWVVLEVNSAPGLDFFESEREILITKILNFLIKKSKR